MPTWPQHSAILAISWPYAAQKSGPRLGKTPFFKKTVLAPSTRKNSKTALKKAPVLLLWPHLGLNLAPSWAHLGLILAPSWLHLGLSWPILAPSWPHLGFILAQLSQDKANIGQQRPNIALTWANISQHRSSLGLKHANLAST